MILSDYTKTIMKLFSLLVSAVLLAVGWSMRWKSFAIYGASLYIFISVIGLIGLVRLSIAHRRGKLKMSETGEKKSIVSRLSDWLNHIILFSSLPAMLIGGGGKIEALSTSAAIIWFGSVALWIAAGFIIEIVGGIPLEMTYGGWKVRGSRRGRRW